MFLPELAFRGGVRVRLLDGRVQDQPGVQGREGAGARAQVAHQGDALRRQRGRRGAPQTRKAGTKTHHGTVDNGGILPICLYVTHPITTLFVRKIGQVFNPLVLTSFKYVHPTKIQAYVIT